MTEFDEELRARARDAAPARPEGDHVGDAALAALRADSEDPALDDAYRHLASCAACRARLAEPAVQTVERVAIAVRGAYAAVDALAARDGLRVRPRGDARILIVDPARADAIARAVRAAAPHAILSRSRPQALVSEHATDALELEALTAGANVTPIARWRPLPIAAFAAAALVLFAAIALSRRPRVEPLDVSQRMYPGTMGSADDAGPLAASDLNLELSFDAKRAEAATLIVIDRDGRRIAPPRPFTRAGDSMRAIVAPRTFAAHAAPALGLVIAGSPAHVRAVVDEALLQPFTSETELRTIASRHDAIVQRVTIDQ